MRGRERAPWIANHQIAASLFFSVVVVAAIWLVFFPALGGDWVWDDRAYLLSQPMATDPSFGSIWWAFSLDSAVAGHYHPLTWLSWMLDFLISGEPDPIVSHITNIAFHTIHCLLLIVLFREILARSGLQAPSWAIVLSILLYALHPMRVESVAWVTERRDVLSGVFYAASLILYLRSRSSSGQRELLFYAWLMFVACGLSKAWAVTIPAVMWILDFMVTGDGRRAFSPSVQVQWVRSRAPFLAGALLFIIIGIVAAFRSGAMVPLDDWGISERIEQAAYAWWYYPLTTLWPEGLAPYYSWASIGEKHWFGRLGLAGLLLVSLGMLFRFPGRRFVLAALLSYSVIVLPVLGLLQSGPQLVADRYAYLAILPFHVLLAAGVATIGVHMPRTSRIAAMILLILCVIFSISAFRLNSVFSSDLAMWTRVVEVNPEDIVARSTRSMHAWRAGEHTLAEDDLVTLVALRPMDPGHWLTLLDVRISSGRADVAQRQADEFPSTLPHYVLPIARSRLARARGDLQVAADHLTDAIKAEPQNIQLRMDRVRLLVDAGNPAEARAEIESMLSKWPENASILLAYSEVLASIGRLDDARDPLLRALQVAPDGWHERPRVVEWLEKIEKTSGDNP